ncbi:hypothetical protein LXL04_019648 [Taraxacum kok-saghyz]
MAKRRRNSAQPGSSRGNDDANDANWLNKDFKNQKSLSIDIFRMPIMDNVDDILNDDDIAIELEEAIHNNKAMGKRPRMNYRRHYEVLLLWVPVVALGCYLRHSEVLDACILNFKYRLKPAPALEPIPVPALTGGSVFGSLNVAIPRQMIYRNPDHNISAVTPSSSSFTALKVISRENFPHMRHDMQKALLLPRIELMTSNPHEYQTRIIAHMEGATWTTISRINVNGIIEEHASTFLQSKSPTYQPIQMCYSSSQA